MEIEIKYRFTLKSFEKLKLKLLKNRNDFICKNIQTNYFYGKFVLCCVCVCV